jgi:hypothetical protein
VLATRAKSVYVDDISYGRVPKRRGNWFDKLEGIEKDLAAMRARISAGGAQVSSSAQAISNATVAHQRPVVPCRHVSPETFRPGQALDLTAGVGSDIAARLFYRHVNQAERWRNASMVRGEGGLVGTIPADYTNSPFPLQYYFELTRPGAAWLYPAFNATLSNQPYFAVWRRS